MHQRRPAEPLPTAARWHPWRRARRAWWRWEGDRSGRRRSRCRRGARDGARTQQRWQTKQHPDLRRPVNLAQGDATKARRDCARTGGPRRALGRFRKMARQSIRLLACSSSHGDNVLLELNILTAKKDEPPILSRTPIYQLRHRGRCRPRKRRESPSRSIRIYVFGGVVWTRCNASPPLGRRILWTRDQSLSHLSAGCRGAAGCLHVCQRRRVAARSEARRARADAKRHTGHVA